jgi:hypothetical protein
MRKAILNSENRLTDIRTEYEGVHKSVEVTEEQVTDFLNKLNNDYHVFYNDVTKQFFFTKNISKIKNDLRVNRDEDLRNSDIYVMNDIWTKWTEEQKNVISIYRQDLRDYINNIKTIEDIDLIEYPKLPDFIETI